MRRIRQSFANFYLSKYGGILMLVDLDVRGNQLVDLIRFEPLRSNAAVGRIPDGIGDFRLVAMTPGTRNRWERCTDIMDSYG